MSSSKKVTSQMAKLEAELKRLRKEARSKTNKGCVRFDANTGRWSFTWRENGTQKYKYFSVKKLGEARAKRMAEQYRKKVLG